MSLKVNTQAEFDAKLALMTQGLQNKQIIKDDMSVAKKGGKAWAVLSFFCKIFLIDINKHYRPKVVVPKMKDFFKANIEFITDEAKKQAVCDVMRALDRSIVDKKGNRKYHTEMVDNKRVIKQMFIKRHPALGNGVSVPPPLPGDIPPPPPPPSGNIPLPPPPPPPSSGIPPRGQGHAVLMAAIRNIGQESTATSSGVASTSTPASRRCTDNQPSTPTSSTSTSQRPPSASNVFGGFNPAEELARLRNTPTKEK